MKANINKESFIRNLYSFNDQLYYYALQLTDDSDEASDLVQETNYKALKNYIRLKDDHYRNAWLFTILKNTHINNLRSGYRKNIIIFRNHSEQYYYQYSLPESEFPDSIYERKELKDKIRILPTNYSRPLKLYLAGYSYKEIANMLDIPLGTVKSRIHLAKVRLKKVYEEN